MWRTARSRSARVTTSRCSAWCAAFCARSTSKSLRRRSSTRPRPTKKRTPAHAGFPLSGIRSRARRWSTASIGERAGLFTLAALTLLPFANALHRGAEFIFVHRLLRVLDDVLTDERRRPLIGDALRAHASALKRQERQDRRRQLPLAQVDVLLIEPPLLSIPFDCPVSRIFTGILRRDCQ